ncbi:MAG: sugar phosphate isomerase/epimerase family protein [Blastocatellia bacterium]
MMISRRDFARNTALGLTAAALPTSWGAGAMDAPGQPRAGGLKKGVLISMLPKQLSYYDRFQLAREVGFEGVEMQTVADPKEAETIREASVKAGLPIHSVMNSDHWRFPLSDPDPEVVRKCVAGMETSLRNAKLWGADTVLLVPAVVTPKTTIPQAWQRSQAEIRKMIPLAKELGVIIGVEEVWNKFLLTPYEHARYVDELKSPWVNAYFDVGNIVMYGYPQEWIRVLGKRIGKIHLKDFKTDNRQFVPLREGSIDWPEVRRAIGEIGFQGYLTVELPGGDEAYLREVSRRVDQILAGE